MGTRSWRSKLKSVILNNMPNNTNKDWTGNAQSMYATLCATNHSTTERAGHDYYATEPKAIELLMDLETFE